MELSYFRLFWTDIFANLSLELVYSQLEQFGQGGGGGCCSGYKAVCLKSREIAGSSPALAFRFLRNKAFFLAPS